MADFRAGVVIYRPVEAVFDFVTTIENAPLFMPKVLEVGRLSNDPVGVGTKYIEYRLIRTRKAKSQIEVTRYEKNKAYTTTSVAGNVTTIYNYEFEEIEEGTQVQLSAEVHVKGLLSFMTKPTLVNIIRREDANMLGYLKRVMDELEWSTYS